jgi:hypothetical protein
MRLTVWDEDVGSRDDLIGSYLIEMPLTVEEAKRRKGADPYQEEGFMFPFSRLIGEDNEVWSSSCWYPLVGGQGGPAGECHLKIQWVDWNSEPVEEGGADDPGEVELIGAEANASRPGSRANMSKDEWLAFNAAEKAKRQEFCVETLIDISRSSAVVEIEGIEIVGSTICEGRDRCPFGAKGGRGMGVIDSACKCVSQTIQVWAGSLKLQHCELHGCVRANGPGATVMCAGTTISGSQRPGIVVSGGAWAELSGGSVVFVEEIRAFQQKKCGNYP